MYFFITIKPLTIHVKLIKCGAEAELLLKYSWSCVCVCGYVLYGLHYVVLVFMSKKALSDPKPTARSPAHDPSFVLMDSKSPEDENKWRG